MGGVARRAVTLPRLDLRPKNGPLFPPISPTHFMDRLHESLHDAPIIDKDGYQYLVHPISNGVPMLEPELLREVVVGVSQAADLDVDKIVAASGED